MCDITPLRRYFKNRLKCYIIVTMPVDRASNTRILLTISHELRRQIAIVRQDRRITESAAIRELIRIGLRSYDKRKSE